MRHDLKKLVIIGGLASVGFGVASAQTAHASTLNIDYLDAVTFADRNINSSPQSLAQSFSPTISGDLTSAAVVVSDTGKTGTLTVAIEGAVSADPDIGGLWIPNGTRLASQAVSHESVPDTFQVMSVDFASPAFVEAGNRYTLVLETDTGDFKWYVATGNYPDEYESARTTGHWATGPSLLAFGIYITTDQTNQSPDVTSGINAHVQQFGFPESGICQEAAPTDLNWAGVPNGGWGESWAQWMNDGLGGPVCTRTLVYSNSQGRWVLAE